MTTNPRGRWLILSHAFNMDGRAASHTITDKIPHLLAAGVTPVILSAKTGRKDARLEHHQLFPLGPVGLRFDLRHVLRQRWGKDWRYRTVMLLATLALLPAGIVEKLRWPLESQWSWWLPAYRKGLKLIRAGKIDLIYSTGGAYAAHAAAARLKQKTGLPWIAEIHDPLVNPGETPQTAQDNRRAEIERLVCTHADIPFWFTEQALASARQRHPQLGQRGKMLLPGADAPPGDLPAYQPGKTLVLGHFGSLSPTRHLANVIQALEQLTRNLPDTADRIELHVYGTDPDPHTRQAFEQSRLARAIHFHGRLEYDPATGKSGRRQVLERMRAADVLLLQHGMEPMCREYIPSKLYEYLWMQRPILGLVHDNPQLEQLLKQAGHRAVESTDLAAQTEALATLYTRWRDHGLPDNHQPSAYTTAAAVQQLLQWVHALKKETH